RQKIDSAKWFIDAIKQRENTMYKTVKTIIQMQEEFFRTGDVRKLKPMVLKDVAQKPGMNISTVSRVTSNKHIETPFGNIPLKMLFGISIHNADGEDTTSK